MEPQVIPQSKEQSKEQYKYFELIMAAFVTVLLCANLIGPAKIAQVSLFGHLFVFSAGVLFFPMSYLFSDFMTEVYGYANARKVVWAGFGAQIFASFMAFVVVSLPPAEGWGNQAAYETVFGTTWRIVLGSILAYTCGSFCNNYVLAKMKVRSEGRFLFLRTIGSTVVGEGVDTLIFYPIAFWGTWSTDQIAQVMLANYSMKVLWEVFATPVTYQVVAWLKRIEHSDVYDRNTNFTPFSIG